MPLIYGEGYDKALRRLWKEIQPDQQATPLPKQKPLKSDTSNKFSAPLRIAAVNGDIQMAVLMLEAGADVNAVAEDGGTALQLAASYKHGGVVDLLLKWKADPNLSAPLMSTVGLRGTPTIALKLIKAGAVATPAALWEAAKTGNTAAAKHLLGAGVDVNAVNDCSDTALSCAVLRGYENFVKLLLDRGADWKVGRNLVTIAVSRQHLNIARELLNRGARPS